MPEPLLDKTLAEAGFQEVQSGAEKIGRRAGLACYFLFLVYVLSAGAVSIIGQVYGISGSRKVSAQSEGYCAREIQWLKREILARAGENAVGDDSQPVLPSWLARWDERFRALGDTCGRLELARVDLKSLRDKYEAMLLGYRRQQVRLVKRIDRELEN